MSISRPFAVKSRFNTPLFISRMRHHLIFPRSAAFRAFDHAFSFAAITRRKADQLGNFPASAAFRAFHFPSSLAFFALCHIRSPPFFMSLFRVRSCFRRFQNKQNQRKVQYLKANWHCDPLRLDLLEKKHKRIA